MQINTQFSLDDVVWRVKRISVQVWHKCAFCTGNGMVVGADGTSQECPKCRGLGGEAEYIQLDPWCVSGPLTITSVEVRHYYKRRDATYEERYKTHEAGRPGGGAYELGRANLFGTEQAAIDYVDRANAKLVEPEGVVVCDCCGTRPKCPKCQGYGRYMETEEVEQDE